MSSSSSKSKSLDKITDENIISRKKNFVGNQFDDFNNKMDCILKEFRELNLENSKILTENKLLEDKINITNQKIDELEQKKSLKIQSY
ncbi:unnamed protein product [Macrosiphum euphorbiae]|uniref:Uncharacterized protein n=1 Tax=Macrosiphum euphorbiae TaxID=13131 RepID=A0AAV0X6S8_9HEMI|nr:unnamed protein product [Macrosiphum euphorbiae]